MMSVIRYVPKHLYSRVIIRKPKIIFKDLSAQEVVGLAYSINDGEEHKAEIEKNQTDRELLLTSFHEISHLMLPELSEAQIIRLEKTYGVALWNIVLRLKRKWLNNLDKS